MKYSQGWSILIGAAAAALLYDVLIYLVISLVPGAAVAVVSALATALVCGVLAALLAAFLTESGSQRSAIGAGVLTPFLSVATSVGAGFFKGAVSGGLAPLLFFGLTWGLGIAGASVVGWRSSGRNGSRRRLRRVK